MVVGEVLVVVISWLIVIRLWFFRKFIICFNWLYFFMLFLCDVYGEFNGGCYVFRFCFICSGNIKCSVMICGGMDKWQFGGNIYFVIEFQQFQWNMFLVVIYCYYYVVYVFVILYKYCVWWIGVGYFYFFCLYGGDCWGDDMDFFIVKQVVFFGVWVNVGDCDVWMWIVDVVQKVICYVNYCFNLWLVEGIEELV